MAVSLEQRTAGSKIVAIVEMGGVGQSPEMIIIINTDK
jgi:hypothetical protein